MLGELQAMFPGREVHDAPLRHLESRVVVVGPWGHLEYRQAHGLVELNWQSRSWLGWVDVATSLAGATARRLEVLELALRGGPAPCGGWAALEPDARQLVPELAGALGRWLMLRPELILLEGDRARVRRWSQGVGHGP